MGMEFFRNIRIFVLFAVFLIMGSCVVNTTKNAESNTGKPLAFEYAKGIEISDFGTYHVAVVKDPWNDGKVLHKYILVPRDEAMPESLPEGTVVRVPIESALVYSAVHCEVIRELTRTYSAVKGVCDLDYFHDPEIIAGVKSGRISDCGNSMSPTIEKVVQLNPDAILLSPFQNSGYGALASTKIPIIECADYMEHTPLGRAEWIKFYGLLFGHFEHSESIFLGVKHRYNKLVSLTRECIERPMVLTETVLNGVWYVPGGRSYMAHIIQDAGGDFPWSDNNSSGSVPLDYSQVLARAYNADIWLIKTFAENATLADIKAIDSRNDRIQAFKNGGIWVCNSGKTTLYEDFPFHPDVLLREFIAIFHPNKMPEYKHKYYLNVTK